jgi:xanthine/CO dehydrogenase XdhC/CoxF family maturation factor
VEASDCQGVRGRDLAVGTAPDSRLEVDADGNFSASVSGGCVEAEVISAALEAMQAGAPRLRAPITSAFVRCRHRSR